MQTTHVCYYIYNKVSYSNFLDTGPSLVDSLAEMEVVRGFVGSVKLVVLSLLCCKISLNINNNTCIIIPYTICLLEFEKNKGRIAFTD